MAGIDPRAAAMGRQVQNLVNQRFGGDQQRAFNHYAGGAGREVSREGVNRLLSDANVGNGLTRGAYTSGVMDQFDTNRNNAISWSEFQSGMRRVGQ
jgi:hypothetical protein